MSYIALYRKWRPKTFNDLIGQDHIARTLINALKSQRVAHAYLFCGPRGTGKTSSARLLAKSLNCEKGISPNPCNICVSCKEINIGSSLDVIEIDAASNRGVDDVRTLREQVKFTSLSGKYKVYIIDEFHMLTNEAFNALLKTLEEPPEKVVFVLATTEAHKVLPTIISRCQRFDFRRITLPILIDHLKKIAKFENINLSEESIVAIARKANGGLRDALSLLDQISSLVDENGNIPTQLVFQVLGLIIDDSLIELTNAIADNNSIDLLEIIDELVKSGNDPIIIVKELISLFRNLLIIKSRPKEPEKFDIPTIHINELSKLSTKFSQNELLYCIELLNETAERLRRTPQSQIWLEANLIRLCQQIRLPLVSQLQMKVEELEMRLSAMEKIKTLSLRSDEKFSEILKEDFLKKKDDNIIKFPQKLESEEEKLEKTTQLKKIDLGEKKVEYRKEDSQKKEIWEQILEEVKSRHIPTEALLKSGKLGEIDIEKGILHVYFPVPFLKEKLDKSQKKELIEICIKKILNKPLKLKCSIGEPPEEFPKSLPFDMKSESIPQHQEEKEIIKPSIRSEIKITDLEKKDFTKTELYPDIIKRAVDIFKGKIIQENSDLGKLKTI